jgi:hypothetical protein
LAEAVIIAYGRERPYTLNRCPEPDSRECPNLGHFVRRWTTINADDDGHIINATGMEAKLTMWLPDSDFMPRSV